MCDGAAAIVLTAEPHDVRVTGLGSATDTSSLLDRESLWHLPATARAAQFAYWDAGIADIRAVRGLVAELHDAFNSLLPIDLFDLGLFDEEQAIDALIGSGRGDAEALDPYTNLACGPRGRVPVNLSGGLKARGHPVGGTGLFQIAELYLQLTGCFPNPRAQVLGARAGLAQSIGGPGNNVYVTLIERTDSGRERCVPHGPPPARRIERRTAPECPPGTLHGSPALIEAATTIHVTASGSEPLHVALLSVGDRRVFARFDAPPHDGAELATLAGRRARFLVKGDGDHYFQLAPARWDLGSLWKQIVGRVLGREDEL